jgi:hypothetical protein
LGSFSRLHIILHNVINFAGSKYALGPTRSVFLSRPDLGSSSRPLSFHQNVSAIFPLLEAGMLAHDIYGWVQFGSVEVEVL